VLIPDIRDYSKLIAHQSVGVPPKGVPLNPPRPARCTARSYGGEVVVVDGVVASRMGDWLAFSAEYEGWGQWIAIVRSSCCEPLDASG
jgi:hypothetical protein